MPSRYPQRSWHTCAICGTQTHDAICGNRLLLSWDMSRLPTEQAPAISWRCLDHQQYKMREATMIQANELGDLTYSLTCSHEVQWIFRGVLAYTATMIARGLVMRRLRLDQPQRCYLCGDLEEGSQAQP